MGSWKVGATLAGLDASAYDRETEPVDYSSQSKSYGICHCTRLRAEKCDAFGYGTAATTSSTK
ncbi:uncharacterized protein MEPE_05663 [Melanopsichium pennsylvanicum]|uniref:Uncharacterized protein n=1 Tax=Melanopsichium pennsylvanicum TaxID=63383 RepID=A0AAJ5C7Y6_9BASI|nr:uncharacterized protein MEPE_05663 [Melanopsichium pennsylvanicum]